MSTNKNINWLDAKCLITEHFTVHDACWLHSWGKLHLPTTAEKDMIIAMAEKMEAVRAFLGGKPISVNCWCRPKDYNLSIGGAPASYHIVGGAVDFTVAGMSCDEVRSKLVPVLKAFGLRCENLPGSVWVHLDKKPVPANGIHFFKP